VRSGARTTGLESGLIGTLRQSLVGLEDPNEQQDNDDHGNDTAADIDTATTFSHGLLPSPGMPAAASARSLDVP
jgi:hypothetical protein